MHRGRSPKMRSRHLGVDHKNSINELIGRRRNEDKKEGNQEVSNRFVRFNDEKRSQIECSNWNKGKSMELDRKRD